MSKWIAVLIITLACAANAFAWGEEGHRIVCRVAYDLLTPDERTQVDHLVKEYPFPSDTDLQVKSFADSCVFPDEARKKALAAEKAHQTDSPWLHYQPYKNWHFLNVARGVHTIEESACANDCVLTAIDKHAGMLKDGTNDQERGEGLIFLGHWIGDIHQPLHVSFASDQGGNLVQPITGGFYPEPAKYPLNLHAVWDGSIIRVQIKESGWRAFADRISAKITDDQKTKWGAATPLAWAQESYDITTSPKVQYCKETAKQCVSFGEGRQLTKEYQDEFVDDVDLRLKQAGVRLAEMIHKALAH